jgi:hypothetical protein
MEFLSLDVFKEIFLEVKDADIANLFAVSKKFNKVNNDQYIWKKRYFHNDFSLLSV